MCIDVWVLCVYEAACGGGKGLSLCEKACLGQIEYARR